MRKVIKNIECSLDLSNTNIIELPEGLNVGGSLDLSNTNIIELPEGLNVGGSLDLSNTGIIELPKNLSVGGSLDLRNSGIPVIHNDTERCYELRAVKCGKQTWYVAGCRCFTSKADALAHWGGENYPNKARGQAFCEAIT